MRRAILVLLAVVVAAGGVVGCGDSDNSTAQLTQSEFKQEYSAISKQIAALGVDVGEAINKSTGKSPKQLSETFGALADKTRSAAKDLGSKSPPDNPAVEKAQASLVKGLNTAADDLQAISDASAKKDLKAAGTAAGKLTRDNAGVATPRRDLDKLVLGITPATASGTPTTTNKD